MSATDSPIDLRRYRGALEHLDPFVSVGEITEIVGLLLKSAGPQTSVGNLCEVRTADGRRVMTQVVGFRDGQVLSMALGETEGIQPGNSVYARTQASSIPVGRGLLGRVLDGFGRPMDGGPPVETEAAYRLQQAPPNPLSRRNVTEPLVTGIRAIDSVLTCGKGQRVGIFGGSGVGKSTLLGAMSKHNSADMSVIALVGERNREVREFIDHELGPEGLKRSVVIVSTSDRPAPLRVNACFVALAVSEYFRDRGADVLLVMDSITRLAMAQREIGLSAGEPPSQKGYTPSVFNLLPRVFERAGNFAKGSITGFFTVLVEGDDFNEPICDAARSILDGHVVLSRKLSSSGHYPAIDVLESVSRLSARLSSPEQRQASQRVREALAAYSRAEELIHLGAYVEGTNKKLDSCLRELESIQAFLRQGADEQTPYDQTVRSLTEIANRLV